MASKHLHFSSNVSKTSISTPIFYDRLFPGILAKRESSSSLPQDEETLESEEPAARDVLQEHSSFQFEGVRFTPRVIEFSGAFEGKQFHQLIKLQNVAKDPALVKIGEPSSFIFHMNKHDRTVKLLPSGRSITRKLTYVYHSDDLVQRSQIRVQINGRRIDYPIVVKEAVPAIEVQPSELDFKVINMGASAKILKLVLTNTGGRGTKFAIDLGRNELDLVVNPPRGTIRAKNQITVHVEMVGIMEGEFYKELWITTTERPIRVPIIAEVMRPRLEVFHPNATGDFTLIDFPPTFVGTQRLDSFVLRNFSADMTPFVTFAEFGNELKSFKDAKKFLSAFNMFMISAEEGRLEPFESRIVTVVFKPHFKEIVEGWHHKVEADLTKNHSSEYLIFCRINRVHCIEKKELEKADKDQLKDKKKISPELIRNATSVATISSVSTIGTYIGSHFEAFPRMSMDAEEKWAATQAPIPFEDKDIVRLCLHGEAVEPHLLLQPDALHFQKVAIGERKEKVLKLTNLSIIPMMFKFHKVVNVNIEPSTGWLKPNEAIDVTVIFAPSFPGKLGKSLKVEVFGKSAVLFDGDLNLKSLKFFHIKLHSSVLFAKAKLEPRLGLGITPEITNEVGVLSELVTYKSAYPKPYAAVLKALEKKHQPRWMLEERDKINNVENAVIAFPNDRPRNFQSWPPGKVYRSIFTGFFRYKPPPDEKYALSKEEFEKKMEGYRIWKEYLKKLAEFRRIKSSDEMTTGELSDYDISCMEILNFKNFPQLCAIAGEEYMQSLKSTLRKDSLVPRRVLIPLSPLYLCNIKVEPKLIDFSMVAPNSSAYEILKLHNMNSFPVSVRFIPGKSGVTLPDGDMRIIPPLTKKLLQIVFKTKDFGRYNGFLDYVINGSHQFKITVSANVVPKTLSIPEEFFNIEMSNHPVTAAFQPESKPITLTNILKSPVRYHWEMQSDSSFEIEPTSGEVPPRATLMNQIYFNHHPERSFFAEAVLVSESGAMQPIKLARRKPRPNVFFEPNKIVLPDLSLNILQKMKARLRNVNYCDVCFEVLDWNPMPGVKVSPRFGIVKNRSFFSIDVVIQIPVIITFQFEVRVRVQQSGIVTLKVSGTVVCPQIKVNPLDVTMRRISAQSFDIATLCIENIGTTSAHVLINFKDYPEYSISRKKERLHGDNDEEGVDLEPGKTAKFFIHFEPSDMARYQFYLPIVINGILGPPMMQDSATEYPSYYLQEFEQIFTGYGEMTRSTDIKIRLPCACINCTVSGHILKLSTLEVNFRLLSDYGLEFQEEEIEITNLHVAPVTFCIRTDDVNHKDSPFVLSVYGYSGTEYRSKSFKFQLRVQESLILKAAFRPKKMGIYSVEAPIFVRGYNNGYAYNVIRLYGELKKSAISADSKEIHFPPVPLGIGSDVIVQVFAERYQNPDVLNCVVWEVQEFGKMVSEAVKTVWLEEPKITGDKEVQVFLIQVCFQSSYPVSLRTFLLFSDTRGEYLSVLVTGISDNSSLTNHIFMSMRCQKYKLIREATPAPVEEDPGDAPTRKTPSKNISRHNTYKKNAETSKRRLKSVHNSKSDFIVQPKDPLLKVSAGPKLAIQMTKSMTRLTQLNFITIKKNESFKKKESYFGNLHSIVLSHTDVLSNATNTSSLRAGKGLVDNVNEISYPDFPSTEDNAEYEKYSISTLKYVELWIYEVGFRCEEYMQIPSSFQMIAGDEDFLPKKNKHDREGSSSKSVVDLLVEFAGPRVLQFFPERPNSLKDPNVRVEYAFSMFYCLLHFLFVQGSFLPHVKPEYLLTYKDYVIFKSLHPACETLKCGAGFPSVNPFRKMSSSIMSSGSKSTDRDEIYPHASSSLGTLNEAWNKSTLDENFDEDLNDFREPKRNVEIGEAEEKPFQGTRDNYMDTFSVKDHVFVEEVLDEKAFDLRSTQAWLDVLIQIFRTLVLTKVIPKRMPIFPVVSDADLEYSADTFGSVTLSSQEIPRRRESLVNMPDQSESNIYTYQERILISWLSHHYEVQRTVLWPSTALLENGAPAPPREFDSFRTDLMDSLFFMAVTSSYCPYLIPNYFIDVFTSPQSFEQIYHNAIKVTAAWKEINLGLTVEPRDIVAGNQVFMIMIVHHLYETLPLLCPRSIIRFSAPLTEEMIRSIELQNKSTSKVVYEAKFIGDDQGSFRFVNNSSITIKGSKKTEFRIAYRARRIERVSVTVIFCGASVSPNFAKSLVFQLEGEPSDLKESTKIKITGSLYKVKCMDISIVPPYRQPSHYEIFYSTSNPRVATTLSDIENRVSMMKPWSDIAGRKIARRLFLNQDLILYDGTSPAILNVTLACLTVEPRSFWLLFKSDEVGDFIIRIDITTKRHDLFCGPIYVDIPTSWCGGEQCTCIDIERNLRIGSNASTMCPLLSFIKVPSRNSFLWDAMLVMFQKALDVKEKTFWRKHFDTDIGIRLINWLLSQDEIPEEIDEFIPCLRTQITYTLKVDSPADDYLCIPSYLDIPDVRSQEPVYLPIHKSSDDINDFKMTLTMTSDNKKELRTIKYVFRKKERVRPYDGEDETVDVGKGICPIFD